MTEDMLTLEVKKLDDFGYVAIRLHRGMACVACYTDETLEKTIPPHHILTYSNLDQARDYFHTLIARQKVKDLKKDVHLWEEEYLTKLVKFADDDSQPNRQFKAITALLKIAKESQV